jgi:hypothetical protein
MSPYVTPSSKVWCHNTQGSPCSHQICSSEGNEIEDSSIDMVSFSWIIAMEFCHLSLCMGLVMYLPAIVSVIVSFPLKQVLKVIVPYSTV